MSGQQPLTTENLEALDNQTTLKEPWYQKPCSVTGAAKTGMFLPQYRLYLMFKNLDQIGRTGDRLRSKADVFLDDDDDELHLTSETDPPLDLDDYRVWDMLYKRFERRHGRLVRCEVAKLDIHMHSRLLAGLGRNGQRIIDEDEVYISRRGRVCCKEFARFNDVGDPNYWEGKAIYFRRLHDKMRRQDAHISSESYFRDDCGTQFEVSPRERRNKPIEEWLLGVELGIHSITS